MSLEITIVNKIGEKIEEYQEVTGCTKAWLAEKIGVSRQTLNTIINSNNPTVGTLHKVACVLECDITDLYEVTIEIIK